jgi:hypothetical protein
MGRPGKLTTVKVLDGTYRADRDSRNKINKNVNTSKYEVIKNKILEVETLIKDTPVKGNERALLDYAHLYQKLLNILEAPSLESKEPKTDINIMDRLIRKKKN